MWHFMETSVGWMDAASVARMERVILSILFTRGQIAAAERGELG